MRGLLLCCARCRRLLVFPKGNKVSQLSVYLDAPEAAYTPLHMSPKCSFKLTLVNHMDPAKSVDKGTCMHLLSTV